MYGRPQQGDANLAQSIRYLNNRVNTIESQGGGTGPAGPAGPPGPAGPVGPSGALAGSVVIPNVNLVAGTNVIPHGLGTAPTEWWVASPRGAFTSNTDVVLSPEPKPLAYSATSGTNPTTRTIPLVKNPSLNNHILLTAALRHTTTGAYVPISTITGGGATWTYVNRVVRAATGFLEATELWLGVVDSALSSVVITYGGPQAASHSFIASLTEMQGLDGTVVSTASGTSFAHDFGGVYYHPIDSSSLMTVPSGLKGQQAICVLTTRQESVTAGQTNDWKAANSMAGISGSLMRTFLFQRVLTQDGSYPLISTINQELIHYYMIHAILGRSVPLATATIPHGIRETAVDATNLTLDSLSNVTVDLIVR